MRVAGPEVRNVEQTHLGLPPLRREAKNKWVVWGTELRAQGPASRA